MSCKTEQKTLGLPKSVGSVALVEAMLNRKQHAETADLVAGQKRNPDRFWSKVQIAGVDECWEWLAAVNEHGYGWFRLISRHVSSSRMELSHRIAFLLCNGFIPSGMCVLHRCDNPPCCNPKHLFIGTHTDNMKDCHLKGRGAYGDGERHCYAKLLEKTIRQAIALRAEWGLTYKDLSNLFHVDKRTLYSAITGRSWRYLHDSQKSTAKPKNASRT